MHCGNVQTIPASLLLQMSIACMKLHDELEIASASAIQMFCSQIVRTDSLPLDLLLSYGKPAAVGGMSRTDLNAELEKGYSSIKERNTLSADKADQMLKDEFNI